MMSFSPGPGANRVDGGQGIDTVIYSGDVSEEAGIDLDLSLGVCVHYGDLQDTLSNIEMLTVQSMMMYFKEMIMTTF